MYLKSGYFLTVITLCFCAKAEPVPSDLLNEFSEGNHKLTAAIYKEHLKENNGNFLVSPFSVETVLALTQFGAEGETANEIRQALKLPNSKEKIEAVYRDVLPKIKGNDQYSLNSANKVYVKDGLKINDKFRQTAEEVFLAGVENINFTLRNEAAETINGWVERQTDNKIKNLIDPSNLNEDTRLILVNALYFKGKWLNHFENHLTNKAKFYKSQEEVQDVITMRQTDWFNYYECNKLNAKFLELPYQGEDVSMVVVLPNEKYGLSKLEEKLESVFEPRDFQKQNVYVSLPKFTIESKIKFVPILANLGIKKAFSNGADFSGIVESKEGLYISDVVQKTFINVTETGTEAAAATAVRRFGSRIYRVTKMVLKFIANHPFLFYIKLKDGTVLFIGRVV